MNKSILMIGPSIKGNGGIASVIKSYTEIDEINSIVDIISSYKDGSKIVKIIEFLKCIVVCLYKLTFNKSIKIVHIHSSSGASFVRKSCFLKLGKLFKKKVIVHIHGSEFMKYYNKSSLKEKKNISKVLTSADKVIALSNSWKADLMSISKKKNVVIIHNPVKVNKFDKSSCKEKNLVFMGRVGKRKGIYDLLEVMPNIIYKFPCANLYVCGDGEIEEIKTLVEKKNISQNVHILGWINEDLKIDILKKSSINILPSYNEGMPISILEAMASRIPTIATNIAGIPEEIEHGENGFLFDPGDIDKLYNYILNLLSDEKLRIDMGKKSLEKVKEHFDISVIKNELLNLYKEI